MPTNLLITIAIKMSVPSMPRQQASSTQTKSRHSWRLVSGIGLPLLLLINLSVNLGFIHCYGEYGSHAAKQIELEWASEREKTYLTPT